MGNEEVRNLGRLGIFLNGDGSCQVSFKAFDGGF